MSTIGVFDSGVGGLTVLQALRRRLPHHDFIYLGDTARVPYGRKPPEMVVEFAQEIGGFLCRQGVDRMVVACNTASAVALEKLEARCPVPVWGVIDPGVSAATHATRSGHVGVIGTKATIGSGAYQRRLEAQGLQVWARACPMLVHIVEEGLADAAEAELLARHYLADRPDIDTLILGCTHYPLLKAALQRVVGNAVRLVDSAEATADVVSRSIDGAAHSAEGKVIHYVTGDSAAFAHTAQVIGGVAGEIRLLPVTDLLAHRAEGSNGKLRPTSELAALGGHPNLLSFVDN
jgi:glutamate racemase